MEDCMKGIKHLCNIHNISVELNIPDKKREKLFLEKFLRIIDGFSEYFSNEKTDKKIIIHDINDLKIPDHALTVPGNAYYFKGLFYSLEAQIAFQFTEYGMDFWAFDNSWYFPYMLQLLLQQEDKTFIHGAGITVNGTEAYLLSAFGGIGKTCFVSKALKKKNVSLLGDDLVILGKDGYCYSYPRPFCLYKYHKALFPQYFKGKNIHFETFRNNRYLLRLTRKIKVLLHIKDRTIYDYIPVSPIHLFSKEKLQIKPAKISKVFILRRVRGIQRVILKKCSDVTKAANFTHDVIQHEWSTGIRLEYNYYAQIEENYAKMALHQSDIIYQAFLHALEIWYADIPEQMTAENVSAELNRIILEESKRI